MSLLAVPTAIAKPKRVPWVLATFISLAVVGVAIVILALVRGPSGGATTGEYYHVAPISMDITINKDGELQAVNNVEITCQVDGSNTILDIAKEGVFVHKGEVVCRIDSTEIEQKIESAQLDLQRAEADLTAAKESKEIQESSNTANYEAANVDLILAKLDFQEYIDGTYPADLQSAKTNVEMAKIEVKNKEDDLDQTRNLFGKGFVTAVDVKTAEIALLKARNDLSNKTTDLEVLQKYTHEKELTDRRNKVVQADKKLARVQRENMSQLAQKLAELRSREETLKVRQRQMEHLKTQLANCVIKAPQDGMVVYASSGSSSWGRRETPIQPGASVRGQELLIRLPDTSSMKAVCRINEGQVSKLRADPSNPMRALVTIVGQPQPLTGWVSNISIMADSSNRFWNPDQKEYPVDVTLDYTPQNLKPGMSASPVQIFVDRLHNVLAVPVGAVYSAGADSYVFVRDSAGPRATKAAIGQVNETHAQITSGLSQGQQVLILQAGQGRDLLEKAGIKVEVQTAPTTQPFDGRPIPPAAAAAAQQRQPGEPLKLDNAGGSSDAPRPRRVAPPPPSEETSSSDSTSSSSSLSSSSTASESASDSSSTVRSSSEDRSSRTSSRRRSEDAAASSSEGSPGRRSSRGDSSSPRSRE